MSFFPDLAKVAFWVEQSKDFLWSGPLLFVLLAVGLQQTINLKGIQFTKLILALKLIFIPKKNEEKAAGDISAFQSLMTALAGAIGTGNITGIAAAVATGGFGALFWMWIMAFVGMATAFAETVLAVRYRHVNPCGTMSGGPMFTLLYALKAKKMALLYALFASIAALGIGCLVQANSVVDAITDFYPQASRLSLGITLAAITGAVVIGGVKSIGRVAGIIVPFMAVMYLIAGLVVLGWHIDRLPDALSLIVSSAFTGQAAVGGFVGSTIMMAMQNGVQYGIFANEAGLGSLAIAAASAKTEHAAEQGLRSLGGVFFATMVVCTLTGLVLAVTQVLGMERGGELVKGSQLALAAFGSVWDGFRYIVLVGLVLFAFTTTLAWAYYGEKAIEFLMGVRAAMSYRWIYTGVIVLGAILKLDLVWGLANLATALMAFPNLLSIIYLSKDVKQESKEYFSG